MRISDWSSDVCSSDLLAPILDIDLDPTRQRLVLDAGTRDGVREGQSVIDAGGLVGQLIEATPTTEDRTSVGSGTSVSVRVDLRGRRIITKKNKKPVERSPPQDRQTEERYTHTV